MALLLASELALSCSSADGGTDAGNDVTSDPGQDTFVPDTPVPDTPADVPPEVVLCTGDCGAMVTIPAGAFQMGCVAGAAGSDCDASEKPTHTVEVPAFDIDVTEVTSDLWARCVGSGGCTVPNASSSLCTYGIAGKEQHPINCISWQQADAFCAWDGKRLCSEAEWEKAAVGTDGRKYPWGDTAPTCERAVLDEGGQGCGTGASFPVGSKPAGDTPTGLKDMAGNVWEWVADYYHASYAGAPADGSAWLDPATQFQVARGGAFSDTADKIRGSARRSFNLALDGYYLGVRCCR
jgi:formylglycine-generating enzyme required for sulfatase activity